MYPYLLDIQLRLCFELSMKSLHSSSFYCVKPITSKLDSRWWQYNRPQLKEKNWKKILLSVSIKCDIGSRMKQVLFSCNLDASSSDDCLGRFKSWIESFISDWSNKEAGNNQQLLVKLSTDMSSSVEVDEYLSASSSRSGRQLNTGLGASTTWETGLKAELKCGYWSRCLFIPLKSFTITLQKYRSATWSICSLKIIGMPKRKVLPFPWDHDLKASTQLVQTSCETHALWWSLSLILKSAK